MSHSIKKRKFLAFQRFVTQENPMRNDDLKDPAPRSGTDHAYISSHPIKLGVFPAYTCTLLHTCI